MKQASVRLPRFNQKEAAIFLRKASRVLKTVDADILFAPAGLALGRILIVTARRTGNAPERNTARRRLRALFRDKKLYALGLDIGVIIKGGVDLSTPELYALIQKAHDRYTQYRARIAAEEKTSEAEATTPSHSKSSS